MPNGKHFMDKLLICVQNLFGKNHPVQPALGYLGIQRNRKKTSLFSTLV